MKTRIENFLNGRIYPYVIVLISLIIWSFSLYLPIESQMSVTLYSLFLLTIPFCLLLIFFKNTAYTIPILYVILFTLGIQNMGIDTIDVATLGFIHIILVLIGFIYHLIRYRVHFKLKTLGLSLILASISFMIPLIYQPFDEVSLILILLLPLYTFIYLFYANTLTDARKTLMRTFVALGLMLSLQIVAIWIKGYTLLVDVNIFEDFFDIFPDKITPGWGNINDLTIHLTLFTAGSIYYIDKYPKSIFPYLSIGWNAFWIVAAEARGSILFMFILALILVIYIFVRRNKYQMINTSIAIFLAILLGVIIFPIVEYLWNEFIETLENQDLNKILTGRLDLWIDHELSAWNLFKQYPIFGYGWNTPSWILNSQNRITVYHSTIFQVLATAGIVGLIILLYQWVMIGKLFYNKRKSFGIFGFILVYIITQLHGLIDNTQYMVHYSIVTYVMFAVIENMSVDIININHNEVLYEIKN